MRPLANLLAAVRQRPRRALLIVAGLALLCLGTVVGFRYLWSRQHLRAAEDALKRHDLATAQHHVEQSLGWWSNNPRANFLAAQLARRRDDCAGAERLLTQFEKAHGANPDTDLEWLLLAVQQGDYAEHERYLQSQIDGGSPAAVLMLEALARGYMNAGRWAEAANCTDILLQNEPKHVAGLLLRGRAWEGLRRHADALTDYQQAADLLPQGLEARLALAEILSKVGRVREAAGHYEVLRAQQPTHPDVLLGLARCRFDAHELDETRRLLDALLSARPDHAAALVERARLALRLDELESAEAALARAVKAAPWHREAWQLHQRCLEGQDKSAEAEKASQQLRALHASDLQAARLSARLRGSPGDPAVRCELGKWCLANGEPQAAMRWLWSALRVDPQHGPTHALLAEHFERAGQPRRAAHHRELATGARGTSAP
jgi:tetratricopeptide (TPR) repeat protein